MASIGEITIGAFEISDALSGDKKHIHIFSHELGEGADFHKEDLEAAIKKFYEENF